MFVTGREAVIQNSYQYDAFGAEAEVYEQFPNRIRYTGQQYDELTGQYYLRARYYDPLLGRFMQEDVYQGDGLNLYAYCHNNPVVYYDPSGYDKEYDGGIIPSIKHGFNEWFDSIEWEDFKEIWDEKILRDYIKRQTRKPYGLHEWAMAAYLDYFKSWGVSMEEIKLNRDVILGLNFINPDGYHGGTGSGDMHTELAQMIKSSMDYEDFKRQLRTWADYRLPEIEIDGKIYPGSVRLPGYLRNQEAMDYLDYWYEGHPEEQNRTESC